MSCLGVVAPIPGLVLYESSSFCFNPEFGHAVAILVWESELAIRECAEGERVTFFVVGLQSDNMLDSVIYTLSVRGSFYH